MYDWNPPDEDQESVRAWLATWQSCIRSVDFDSARTLFAGNIASFGTHMHIVEGLDALEANQWRNVWPMIADFSWDFDRIRIGLSGDRLLAFLIATWRSTGFNEDGTRFERPGRTTVVLSRPDVSGPWHGVHTHFSLQPGTPPQSHGRPSEEHPDFHVTETGSCPART